MSEVRYTTGESVELKYIPVPSPFVWNIFEKYRGKRVFNVPNDLGFCSENPELVLKSDFDKLKKQLEKCKEQRNLLHSAAYRHVSSEMRYGIAKLDEELAGVE